MIEFKVVLFYNDIEISQTIYKYKSLSNFNRFKLKKLINELKFGYHFKVYQKSDISDLQKVIHEVSFREVGDYDS